MGHWSEKRKREKKKTVWMWRSRWCNRIL